MRDKIKVFISQPMTGLTENDILSIRAEEIRSVYKFYNKDSYDVSIINSYITDKERHEFQECMPDKVNWDIYWLSKAIKCLALADVLWLCDGWEYSKGCNIELECAIQYGLDIVYPPMRKEGVL